VVGKFDVSRAVGTGTGGCKPSPNYVFGGQGSLLANGVDCLYPLSVFTLLRCIHLYDSCFLPSRLINCAHVSGGCGVGGGCCVVRRGLCCFIKFVALQIQNFVGWPV